MVSDWEVDSKVGDSETEEPISWGKGDERKREKGKNQEMNKNKEKERERRKKKEERRKKKEERRKKKEERRKKKEGKKERRDVKWLVDVIDADGWPPLRCHSISLQDFVNRQTHVSKPLVHR